MSSDENEASGGEGGPPDADRLADEASDAAEALSSEADSGGALSDEEIAALMSAAQAVREVQGEAEAAATPAPPATPAQSAPPERTPTPEESDMLAAVRAAVAQAKGEVVEPAAPGGMTPGAIDEIAREAQAEQNPAAASQEPQAAGGAARGTGAAAAIGGSAAAFMPPVFEPMAGEPEPEGIDLLSDVNLQVKIELGRTRMLIEDVLRLAQGAVVELDKLAGDPVDVYVNERHVARGEVLVLNDNFCVRISEIIDPEFERVA